MMIVAHNGTNHKALKIFENGTTDDGSLLANVDFSGFSFRNFSFAGSANFDNSIFHGCDFQGATFDANVEEPCSFRGADFSRAINFPFDKKVDFMAAVGPVNINDKTIWIDGTRVLDL